MEDAVDPWARMLHAGLARFTRGLSPASLVLAWSDWAIHLAAQPTRLAQVAVVRPWLQAVESASRTLQPGSATASTRAPHAHDGRLSTRAGNAWPYAMHRELM